MPFFSDAMDYLGHVITAKKLQVAINMKDTVETLKCPTNTTNLRSFVGLCFLYRRFLQNFSSKADPLKKLLKKEALTKFDVNEDERAVVDELKQNLIEPPMHALPKLISLLR